MVDDSYSACRAAVVVDTITMISDVMSSVMDFLSLENSGGQKCLWPNGSKMVKKP